jgi:hypothetical protein
MQSTDLFGVVPKVRRQPAMPLGVEARDRKRNGQFRAMKRAGQQWASKALDMLAEWLAERQRNGTGATVDFTFEDFRLFAEGNRLPAPASLNAWGALPTAAKKLGLCAQTGRAEAAKRPESHGRLINVWRAL